MAATLNDVASRMIRAVVNSPPPPPDGHGGDGGGGESCQLEETVVIGAIALGTIAGIAVLSLVLEKLLHMIQHGVQGSFLLNRVVTNILHEITVLGLLSFALFLLAKIVYTFAPQYHDVLSLIEDCHMLLFIWMILWIGVAMCLFAHTELLFLFFSMAEACRDGRGIKNDRFSRYFCLLNFLTNNGTSQYYNYHRARNTFIQLHLRRATLVSNSDEHAPLITESMESSGHHDEHDHEHEHEHGSETDDGRDDYDVVATPVVDEHEAEHVQEAIRASVINDAHDDYEEHEGAAHSTTANSEYASTVTASGTVSLTVQDASTPNGAEDDFPYNEYLVIVSWKQLLHFLHIDWQSWLVVVLAVGGAYMYVSLIGGQLGDILLLVAVFTYMVTFIGAFVMNRYVYARKVPQWIKWCTTPRGDMIVHEDQIDPRTRAIPANQIPPMHYKQQSDWKRNWRLIAPLPWELYILKLVIFIQIGVSSVAVVFPDKMWCRWEPSNSFIVLLSFEMILLPIATLATALQMFPQFLTSVTLRFPLDEVLRVFGYASETKVETPGNRKSRVIMAAAKLFEKRRAKENAAVRAMVRYRQSTRAKKQKRRWIPFVVKWKKTINICLAIFVVLGVLIAIAVAIVNVVTDEQLGLTLWAAIMLVISLYFLLVLPVWLFAGPLRWFSKVTAKEKLIANTELRDVSGGANRYQDLEDLSGHHSEQHESGHHH